MRTVYAIFALLAGRLADRYGSKRIIAGGSAKELQRHYTLGQALRTAPFWTHFGMYFIICFVLTVALSAVSVVFAYYTRKTHEVIAGL